MAGGGKASPRQRMINMMYLVLTALLALQVSNDVLNKFSFIDKALQHSIGVSGNANAELIEGIKKQVEKNGNIDADRRVFKSAQDARAEAKIARDYIAEMRAEIIKLGEGFNEHGKLKKAKNYDEQMAYTIGPEGSEEGSGYVLEDKLNTYVENLKKITKDSIKDLDPLARAAKDIPEYAEDPDQMNKDFAELTFGHTPNVAVLAVLSQLESEVVRYETEVVEYFAAKVGATKIKFDDVIPMVRPASKVVPAGTEYVAELFISATSKSFTPKMSFNGRPVTVDPESKMGEIKFKANAGANDYDKKTFLAKKTYKAGITIPTPSGRDTTYTVEEEYFVAKPVVQVQSASVQALYLNCGNDLDVLIPAFGEAYDPRFSSSTGEAIKGPKKGNVKVVPDPQKVLAAGKKAKLTVSSTGYSETLTFSVRKIPDPYVGVFKGSKEVDVKNGIACGGVINAKAVPDSDFKAFLPNDARYRVTKVEIILKRGRKAVYTNTIKSGKINLNSICSANFRPGDQLVVTVEEVQRMNFKGQKETVRVPQKIVIIPLN